MTPPVTSLAPYPKPRPPLWLPLIAMAIAAAPTVGLFIWMFF